MAASGDPSETSNLEKAVTAVRRGDISIRKAAIVYGCERSKVWRHLHDKTAHSHAGRPCMCLDCKGGERPGPLLSSLGRFRSLCGQERGGQSSKRLLESVSGDRKEAGTGLATRD